MFRRLFAVVAAAAASVVVPVAHAPVACAAGAHHAALIIDTGDRVVRRCVAFDEDSLTGEEVLDRADVDAVYSNKYSEAFVCSLLGVGNDQAHCPNSDPNKNWVYWQARSGSSVYTRPSQGASNTTVRDGDVEAWHWTTGVPPYSSVNDVCPIATSPTTPTTTGAPPGDVSPPTATTTTRRVPAAATTTSADAPTSTSSTEVTSSSTSTTASDQVALPVNDTKSGSPLGFTIIGALIAGMGIAAWRISKARAARG
jgi:hypothetical protein